MKSQPCASNRRPSRLCGLLLCVFTVKLAILGLMIFDPLLPDVTSLIPGMSSASSGGSRNGEALAATGEGAAASPALPATAPSAMPSGNAQVQTQPSGQPLAGGAAPVNGTGASSIDQPSRALPGISSRQPGHATAGGTGATAETNLTMDTLARRQEELARKDQELRILEGELNAKLEQLQMLENRLTVMIREAEETKDAKFRHLVDVLSNMKAKQAAAVLETLDQKIAVRVLAGMRGRQAGEILTYVKPEIAAHLAEALARMQLPFE